MPTPTGTGTFVDSGTDQPGERFSINDADDTIHLKIPKKKKS
jgi:hypothetical protein